MKLGLLLNIITDKNHLACQQKSCEQDKIQISFVFLVHSQAAGVFTFALGLPALIVGH